jgi:hypothetical protein
MELFGLRAGADHLDKVNIDALSPQPLQIRSKRFPDRIEETATAQHAWSGVLEND